MRFPLHESVKPTQCILKYVFGIYINVKGSKILTLEFLSTLRITKEKIYFKMLNSEFDIPWDAFSTCLGFDIPNIKIEHATKT